MDNFSYCSPTKYVFGRGAENHVAQELASIGATRVMIVYGGGSVVRSGLLTGSKSSLTLQTFFTPNSEASSRIRQTRK